MVSLSDLIQLLDESVLLGSFEAALPVSSQFGRHLASHHLPLMLVLRPQLSHVFFGKVSVHDVDHCKHAIEAKPSLFPHVLQALNKLFGFLANVVALSQFEFFDQFDIFLLLGMLGDVHTVFDQMFALFRPHFAEVDIIIKFFLGGNFSIERPYQYLPAMRDPSYISFHTQVFFMSLVTQPVFLVFHNTHINFYDDTEKHREHIDAEIQHKYANQGKAQVALEF